MISSLIGVGCRGVFFFRTAPCLCGRYTRSSSILPKHSGFSSESRPKKPLTSFFLFCQERRPQLVTDKPELSFSEVGKQLGDEWKSLPDHEKEVFSIQARENMADYQRRLKEFELSLSDVELDELREADERKKVSRKKRKQKAELKRLEKPKRPPTSFSLFLSENMAKGENAQMQLAKLSQVWNNTTGEEKMPYQERSKRLKEDYEIDLEAWKERMIAEGREDLLQKKKTKTKRRKDQKKEDEPGDWDEEEF